ncbi:MAG TPA: uroporphyrinogen-III synthase [Allosphingosinicella sp.]
MLILRPEPGASETAARSRAMGLSPVVAPLFEIRPLPWQPPAAGGFDALLLTSANAARHGGPALQSYVQLPCYCVGEATAAAARGAGFADVRTGPADAAGAAGAMTSQGVRRALHLCGKEHVAVTHASLSIERRIVYEAVGTRELPGAAREALAAGAVALVHSARAGALLASLATDRAEAFVAAISAAAAAAAGGGWREVAVAEAPRDQPLLELAAVLCNIARPGETEWE